MSTAVSSLNDVWGGEGLLKSARLGLQKPAADVKHDDEQPLNQQLKQHQTLLRNFGILQQQNELLKQELYRRSATIQQQQPHTSTGGSNSRDSNRDRDRDDRDHQAVIIMIIFLVLLLVVIVGFSFLGCKLNKVSHSLQYVMARFSMQPFH